MKTNRILAALLTLLLCSAAPAIPHAAEAADDSPAISDPIEDFNRNLFAIHLVADRYLLEPVARLWNRILPNEAQRGIDNFFKNLRYPVNLLNSALQAKGDDALKHTGRFFVNSTVGMAGLFDPATHMGLVAHREDGGQTMAVYGWRKASYILVPAAGPTSTRDALGSLLDGMVAVWPSLIEATVLWPALIVHGINTRSLYLEELDTLEETSLDFYSAIRNGYNQRRSADILDSLEKTEEASDDLYYFTE